MNFQETYRKSKLNETYERVLLKQDEITSLMNETLELMSGQEREQFLAQYQEGFGTAFKRIGNFFTGKGATLSGLQTNVRNTAMALKQVIKVAQTCQYKDDPNFKAEIEKLKVYDKNFDTLLGNITQAEQAQTETSNSVEEKEEDITNAESEQAKSEAEQILNSSPTPANNSKTITSLLNNKLNDLNTALKSYKDNKDKVGNQPTAKELQKLQAYGSVVTVELSELEGYIQAARLFDFDTTNYDDSVKQLADEYGLTKVDDKYQVVENNPNAQEEKPEETKEEPKEKPSEEDEQVSEEPGSVVGEEE